MDLTVLVVGVVGLAALVTKVTDFLRYLTNLPQTKSSIVTQLVAWGGGVIGVFAYSATDFGPTIDVNGILLNNLNSASKLVLGLAIGSIGSAFVDYKQARDNTDSSAVPPLLPGPVVEPPPAP
jgi:hypothetical protein